MTAQEVLDAYVSFLWSQFQYDWGWLSSPWLLVVGHVLYLMFFMIKWMVLLAPITVPITTYTLGMRAQRPTQTGSGEFINN